MTTRTRSPRSPRAPFQSYPSIRPKSVSLRVSSKAFQKLPIRYPLADITNVKLAQAVLACSSRMPALSIEQGGRRLNQVQEAFSDASARRDRGKNRRSQPRTIHASGFNVPEHNDTRLRSPILFVSPSSRSFPRKPFNFRMSTPKSAFLSPPSQDLSSPTSCKAQQPRPSRRRNVPLSLPASETPRHAREWTRRRILLAVRSTSTSPSPTSHRPSGAGIFLAPKPHKLPLPSRLYASSSSPASTQPGLAQQLSLPSAQFVLGVDRKKRTKRQVAALQWQVTLYRSLAWSVRVRARTAHVTMPRDLEDDAGSDGRGKEDSTPDTMNLARAGLMISMDESVGAIRPEGVSVLTGEDTEPHWTEMIDNELVTRLWTKLRAQGCRLVGAASYGGATGHPLSLPRSHLDTSGPDPPSHGIPFPSANTALAPSIQFSSRPGLGNMDSSIDVSPRRRVSAMTFRSPAPAFDGPSIRQPCAVNPCLPPSFPELRSSHHPSHSFRPPGTYTTPQLVAQLMLRRAHARTKPLQKAKARDNPKESGLRFLVVVENK